jgi:hypothetical protein
MRRILQNPLFFNNKPTDKKKLICIFINDKWILRIFETNIEFDEEICARFCLSIIGEFIKARQN